jgi:hypothetical protein
MHQDRLRKIQRPVIAIPDDIPDDVTFGQELLPELADLSGLSSNQYSIT